jgi:hypothetical protein
MNHDAAPSALSATARASLDQIRDYLNTWFPEFKYRPRDDLFFASLAAEFPRVDLPCQFRTFHAWCLDRHDFDRLNFRLCFRKWLVNAKPDPDQY